LSQPVGLFLQYIELGNIYQKTAILSIFSLYRLLTEKKKTLFKACLYGKSSLSTTKGRGPFFDFSLGRSQNFQFFFCVKLKCFYFCGNRFEYKWMFMIDFWFYPALNWTVWFVLFISKQIFSFKFLFRCNVVDITTLQGHERVQKTLFYTAASWMFPSGVLYCWNTLGPPPTPLLLWALARNKKLERHIAANTTM
jgi:hypothetical protein